MPIIDDLLFVVKLLAALGCGLMAGLFFAFSVSVMKALAGLPPNGGMAAMQSINIAIINPVFLSAFFGTAAACLLKWSLSDPTVMFSAFKENDLARRVQEPERRFCSGYGKIGLSSILLSISVVPERLSNPTNCRNPKEAQRCGT